jgi:hypothetical protein
MSKSLEELVLKLEDLLEDKPDEWFIDPKGWLSKPDYKRSAQERSNIQAQNAASRRTSLTNIFTGSYKKRWFVLDFKTKELSYYEDNNPEKERIGTIILNNVVGIKYSSVFDKPEFSLDLITLDKHYTISAESHASMVKWALALKLARKDVVATKIDIHRIQNHNEIKNNNNSNNDIHEVIGVKSSVISNFPSTETKWTRYDYVYEEPGPLQINVIGTTNIDQTGKLLNQWIIVTSFETNADGSIGRSEIGNRIAVKDYVVGVNGIDLTGFSFDDAMSRIGSVPFPKTLHFLRDNATNRESNKAEGWSLVYYNGLDKQRKRYLEFKQDIVYLKKPDVGGISYYNDSYFSTKQIESIRPVVNKSFTVEQQYIIYVVLISGSTITRVDENNNKIGTNELTEISFSFSCEDLMNSWRSALVSPFVQPNGESFPSTIIVKPTEVIHGVKATSSDASETSIHIKSIVTNSYCRRNFLLENGELKWERVSEDPNHKLNKKIFLANSQACNVISVDAFADTLSSYPNQIVIKTIDNSVTLLLFIIKLFIIKLSIIFAYLD